MRAGRWREGMMEGGGLAFRRPPRQPNHALNSKPRSLRGVWWGLPPKDVPGVGMEDQGVKAGGAMVFGALANSVKPHKKKG
jgi:hypothetical protein